MRDIALIGRARSGKDTVGARLVERFGYTRLAFADPLKEMALEINPWIPTGYGVVVRLHRLIADVGWDYAKENYPEVRRILQHTGQSIRHRTPDYWVRALLDTAYKVPSGPIVVTDVRYKNEAHALQRHGFRLVRLVRPGTEEMTHTSETELEEIDTPLRIVNSGTLEDLRAHADTLPF
ncbi:hypothetical protein [Streptomyces sp. NRRL S-475]|uniref:deoxynucleotide monophosphate kinase family protein n=1 Tax=Streptomyces sp. NRRL S-475 TaxID=1463910 RepID=UPI0004BD72A0|nr:hypothetical protein [Streptomyces sp. NRRL S-475]